MTNTAPTIVLAEILRGGRVESVHVGAYAVADDQGRLVASGGDPTRAVFARSAIKALQALPLVATGAAAKFGLDGAELALACASHSGLPEHAATAAAMLRKAGLDETCLECGIHWPSSATAARALAAGGRAPSALHNNCSGKHAGFLCTAIAEHETPAGYVDPDHPTMRRVTQAVAEMTRTRLGAENRATDGCSIPTFAIPLQNLAAGFARFGTGQHIPADFAHAATALRHAAAAHPLMLAGRNRFDTVVTEALGQTAFVKTGAEGVYCGAVPTLCLGFAVKCNDGASRAAEAATAALLGQLLGPHEVLQRLSAPVLKNWNGIEVGRIRACIEIKRKGGWNEAIPPTPPSTI